MEKCQVMDADTTNESMDAPSTLLWLIDSFARRAIGEPKDWYDSIGFLTNRLREEDPVVGTAVSCQEQLLTEVDRNFARPFIEGGFPSSYPDSVVSAIFAIAREIQTERDKLTLPRTLARYSPESDPLALAIPGIEAAFSKRNEMVSVSVLRQIDRSGVFAYIDKESKGEYSEAKLASGLNPELVNFVLTNGSRASKVEVRLDPDYPSSVADPPIATHTPELSPVFLDVLSDVPLKQFLGLKRSVIGRPLSMKAKPWDGLEYFAQGLRSFEAFGTRRLDARVEVYVEELIDTSTVGVDQGTGEITVASDGKLFGHVIHFDTNDFDDTPCSKVELIHLDLAIYSYEGEKRQERLSTPLGTRVEASTTIHLFKAAPIPMSVLPGVAMLFLSRSRRHVFGFFRELRD
jgi:hypothetical protein